MEVSAEMAAEQLLAEEAADQARAEAKKAKKQRQKAKKQQAQSVLRAQQSRQTEQFCIHGRQESQPAQLEEHPTRCVQQEELQAQHAQQEQPQAQHTQYEEQQAQHAQQEEQQAQHAQQCPQFTEHEQDSLAVQDAGQPLVKRQTLPPQHAQLALHSQQAAQSEQPLSKQHTQQQQLGQGCQRNLASPKEQLSAGTESRPHCLKRNSHHQHKQLASGVLPVMLKSEVVSQKDAAAQPSLYQNSQLAGPSRHKAAQPTDDKALFNLFCCPLTKVSALCACMQE